MPAKAAFSLLLLLLPLTAFAGTPTGYQSWDHGEGQKSTQLGGPPRNYPSGSGWSPIENDWFTLDDTLHTNRRGVLKTDVNNSGQIFTSIVFGDDTVTIAQRLLSLKWFRSTDSAWLNIDNTPQWSVPSVDSNQIHWSGVFPGVDVRVGKYDGMIDYSLHFKPAFLDSAVTLFNQRADSADIYLANVIACELIGVADSSLGTITKRKLKQWGKRVLSMQGYSLEYPRGRGDPDIPIYQRHRIIGGKLYIVEFVKMSDLKWAHEQYPTATLWHHSSTVLQSTGLWDNVLSSDNQGNQGGDTENIFFVDHSCLSLIGYAGINAIVGGDNRDSAVVNFRTVTTHFDDGPAELYWFWKYQANETDSDWDDWDDPKGWGTNGCNTANDAGAYNTGDGSGDDRTATAERSVAITELGAYSLKDDSHYPNEGDSLFYALKAGTGLDTYIATTEHGTYPLTVTIYYTAAAPSAAPNKRRELQQQLLQ